MWNVASNTSLTAMQENVCANATSSFEFLSNSILGLRIAPSVCKEIEEVVTSGQAVVLLTQQCATQPRDIACALDAWIRANGFATVCNLTLPKHEILSWLCLDQQNPNTITAVIDVQKDSVHLRWLEMGGSNASC